MLTRLESNFGLTGTLESPESSALKTCTNCLQEIKGPHQSLPTDNFISQVVVFQQQIPTMEKVELQECSLAFLFSQITPLLN